MFRISFKAMVALVGITTAARGQGPRPNGGSPKPASSVADCVHLVEETPTRMRGSDGQAPSNKVLEEESIRVSKECARQFPIKTLSGEDLVTLARLFIGARQDDKATEALNRYVSLGKTDAERAEALATAASPLTGYGYTASLPSRARLAAVNGFLDRLEGMGDVALAQRIKTFRTLAPEAGDQATQRRHLERALKAVDRQLKIGAPDSALVDALRTGAATAALQCELDEQDACEKIDRYLEQLEARPETLALAATADAYWEAGNALQSRDEQLPYFERALELARRASKLDRAPKTTLGTAYQALATAYGRLGIPEKMEQTLERAAAELADGPSVTAKWRDSLAVYTLVGKPAPEIAVTYWLGAKKETPLTVSARGKPVTLIEFTAHYCGPCTLTYPSIREMQRQYGANRFEPIFVTKIYGFFGNQEGLSVEEELKRDKDYWFKHYQMSLRIGLTETPVHNDTANPTIGMRQRAKWQDDYFVEAVPTVVLVDREGIVRLAMTGYLESLVRRKVREMIEQDGKR